MKNNELLSVLSDPFSFISRLKIIGKDGKLITLNLNQEQIRIVEELQKNGDTLILKPRQIGSSTIVSAYLFWKLYTSTEPITIAILSHKLASSKHLLKMHKIFYDNLPNFLKRALEVDNTICIKFKDSGASMIAVSAEGKGGLRSFTCSYLHISEYAFAPNSEELKATALSSLNNGQLIIESTANFFNDALHQEVVRHERGDAKWNYLFFPWYEHSEYRTEIPEDEQMEWDDYHLLLLEKYGLDAEQAYWHKLNEQKMGNKDKFRREYPINIDEAYSISGNVYLQKQDFEYITIHKVEPVGSTILDAPESGDVYAIGVDVSAGVKQDWSVIYVVSKKTHQPVYMWRSNETTPVVLAERIVSIANTYNKALVLVESNNYGHVVLNELRHSGYTNIWTDTAGKDWLTTSKSKTEMFEHLKSKIHQGFITNIDNIVYSELRSITVSDKGLIELKSINGAHSDNTIALALSYIALEKIKLKQKEFLPNWIKTRKAGKIIKSGGVGAGNYRRY
jgi:hypothetical protein